MSDLVRLNVDDGIAWLVLNRPQVLNALNQAIVQKYATHVLAPVSTHSLPSLPILHRPTCAWVHWSYRWEPPSSGGFVVQVRAFDDQGQTPHSRRTWAASIATITAGSIASSSAGQPSNLSLVESGGTHSHEIEFPRW